MVDLAEIDECEVDLVDAGMKPIVRLPWKLIVHGDNLHSWKCRYRSQSVEGAEMLTMKKVIKAGDVGILKSHTKYVCNSVWELKLAQVNLGQIVIKLAKRHRSSSLVKSQSMALLWTAVLTQFFFDLFRVNLRSAWLPGDRNPFDTLLEPIQAF